MIRLLLFYYVSYHQQCLTAVKQKAAKTTDQMIFVYGGRSCYHCLNLQVHFSIFELIVLVPETKKNTKNQIYRSWWRPKMEQKAGEDLTWAHKHNKDHHLMVLLFISQCFYIFFIVGWKERRRSPALSRPYPTPSPSCAAPPSLRCSSVRFLPRVTNTWVQVQVQGNECEWKLFSEETFVWSRNNLSTVS